ncbi:MAG: sodium:proton antiporter [Planctomycetes bacterium]|nr:sodium:proton antiporter [Planctomycetota bacterium]
MKRRRIGALLVIVVLASASAVPFLQDTEPPFDLAWDGVAKGMPFVVTEGARYRKLQIRRMIMVERKGVLKREVDPTYAGKKPVSGLLDDDGNVIATVEFVEGVATVTSTAGVTSGEEPDRNPTCHVDGPVMVDGEATTARQISGFWSIAPAIIAILLAILLREVLLALLLGVWVGVIAIEGDLLAGTLRTFDRHLIGALGDADRLKILVFSCLLGGVVAMISRMGGVRAIVEALAQRGKTPRAAQLTTWVSGILVFFDDYANALLVGNTMRPVSDRFRVSREKLAYLVDSTSAPVACIAPVSTWIAAEVGYIDDWLDPFKKTNPEGLADYTSGYDLFLDSIPYNFYPILALVFGLFVVWLRRDFGPMAKAEVRAAGGKLHVDGARPLTSSDMDDTEPVDPNRLRWWNGALPIATLVLTVMVGLYLDGIGGVKDADSMGTIERLRAAYGKASSYNVLLWASAAGLLMAWLLALGQRLMSLKDASETTVRGIKAMIMACLVLIMAWMLGDVCKTMNTAGWLIERVSFSFSMLPLIMFLLAGVIGFSTGSSWSTMIILIPLAMAYAQQLGLAEEADAATLAPVLLASLGGVLAGAVFGDHCSPISDTTVMSSMASGCDHMEHVKTQLPYALTVGTVAVALGYLPAGFGVPPWVSLMAGAAVLFAVARWVGRPTAASTL